MKIKKCILYILIFAVIGSVFCLPSSAGEAIIKDETVYAKLSNSGETLGVYVVNAFELSQASVISDYGDYEKVLNLTDNKPLISENGMVSLAADEGSFHYQGNPKTYELPWSFDIKYKLDGKDITASELAGKSGELKVSIKTSRNQNADPVFYDSFTVQISVTLESKICSDITAPGATLSSVGSKKQLTYTIMPGNEKEFMFSANVTDFEMEPVTIACVRNGNELDLDISSFDISEMTGDLNELEDGIAQLDDGISELNNNSGELSGGLSEYAEGMEAFTGGIGSLYEGALSVASGVDELRSGLSELSGRGSELVYGAKAMLDSAFAAANTSLSERFSAFGMEAPELTIDNFSSTLDGMISAYPQAKDDLEALKTQLEAAADFYNGVVRYTGSVSSIHEGMISLSEGVNDFKDGLYELSGKGAVLSDSAGKLSLGMYALTGGIAQLMAGSARLREETGGMEEKVNTRLSLFIENMASKYAGEYKAASFVSDKNTNIRSVQFVFKTQGIKYERPEAEKPAEPEKLNLWQRILKLFGI